MRTFIKLIITFNILVSCFANAQNLPDLGNYSSTVLPPVQEQQLGKVLMQQLEQHLSISHDPLINNYINTIGNRLTQHVDNRWTKFHFFIVNSSAINAFTGPGGYVGVNSGLILTTKSESELASVLAHEITHVTQRHIARSIARAEALSLPTLAAALAAAIIASQTSSSVAAGAAMAVLGGSSQSMINFTRSNEQEADRLGIQTLYRTGFNPMAMPTFFRRMQRATLYGNQIPAYLQDHPVTDLRIADAENRARQYRMRKTNSSLEYYLMRARIRVTNTRTGIDIVNYFQQRLTNHTYQNRYAAQYGYAYALLKTRQPASATKVIKYLIRHDPNQVIYQMALADAKIAAKQPQTAVKILTNSLALYPDYYPLIVQYGHTLLVANKANKARRFLQQEISNYPNNRTLYILLARAQGKSGHLAAAYQTRAKLCELYGNNKMAIIQLQQALKQPHLHRNTKAIINANIARLRTKTRIQ